MKKYLLKMNKQIQTHTIGIECPTQLSIKH